MKWYRRAIYIIVSLAALPCVVGGIWSIANLLVQGPRYTSALVATPLAIIPLTTGFLLVAPILAFRPSCSAVAAAATAFAVSMTLLGELLVFFTVNPFITEVYRASWPFAFRLGVIFGACLLATALWSCTKIITALCATRNAGSLVIVAAVLLHLVGFYSFFFAVGEVRRFQEATRQAQITDGAQPATPPYLEPGRAQKR